MKILYGIYYMTLSKPTNPTTISTYLYEAGFSGLVSSLLMLNSRVKMNVMDSLELQFHSKHSRLQDYTL